MRPLDVVCGIFVGGASRRMGGRPKGLLSAPDGSGDTVVAQLVARAREAGFAVVLVGQSDAYATALPGVLALADEPAGVGPLGGLAALLAHAGDRTSIAVACDMPFVTAAVLTRLVRAESPAEVLAPRRAPGAPYEPLLARYDSARALPRVRDALREGVRSFQALFARLAVDDFALAPDELAALDDWDTPGDVTRAR